jgi:endoglycosylceramidase
MSDAAPPRMMLLLVLAVLTAGLATTPAVARAAQSPLHVERGREAAIVDDQGRQVLLRGVNYNQLGDYYQGKAGLPTVAPAARADFVQMRRLGFNVVRLVTNWSAWQPARGAFDAAYLARVRQAVGWAAGEGIAVVLDMHQDAWGKFIATPAGAACPPGLGPAPGWDGAPAWATLTDGLSTCRLANTRELSPAVAQAFQSFYADREGIQSELVDTWRLIARAFARTPAVVGYDLLNEPHPGVTIGLGQTLGLARFYGRAIAAIRAGERSAGRPAPALAIFEPSVLWSGRGNDALPPGGFTTDPDTVFSPHLYAGSISIDQTAGAPVLTVDEGYQAALGAARNYGLPLWSGEWGWFGPPSRDLAKVRRFAALEDEHRLGSAWWVWKSACGDPHVAGQPTFAGSLNPVACPSGAPLGQVAEYASVLSRAYPRAAPGRLTALRADSDTGALRLTGRDRDPGGSCTLELFLPDRGRGEPALQTTGVERLAVRRTPGGWLATGCAGGVYALRAVAGVPGARTPKPTCLRRASVRLRLRLPRGARVRSVEVWVDGRRVRRLTGPRTAVRIPLRTARGTTAVVRLRVRLTPGRVVEQRARVAACR